MSVHIFVTVTKLLSFVLSHIDLGGKLIYSLKELRKVLVAFSKSTNGALSVITLCKFTWDLTPLNSTGITPR